MESVTGFGVSLVRRQPVCFAGSNEEFAFDADIVLSRVIVVSGLSCGR